MEIRKTDFEKGADAYTIVSYERVQDKKSHILEGNEVD